MGAWGQGAFENDDNLDWLGDLNQSMRVSKRIEKDIKRKKYPLTTRGAVEYMIRSDKVHIFPPLEFERLAPIAVERLEYVREEISDPSYWKHFSSEKLSDKDLKDIAKSIRAAHKDIDRQTTYLKKRMEESKSHKKESVSKSELDKQFAKFKRASKKAGKKGKSLAKTSVHELREAFDEMKEKNKEARKKAKKKSKEKASKKKAPARRKKTRKKR